MRRAGSAGPDACEFAESLGYELDDWQRWCIDGVFSEDEDYRLCASACLILVSRQNGKNVILEIVELYAFYVLDWPVIVHTAHRQDTSADHMARLRSVIEANSEQLPDTKPIEANGKEKLVRLDTRAEIRFVTRSKKIGRGKSPRLVVFDEALYLTDEQIQAIIPSLSAQSMRDDRPLMVYTSSAPVPESVVLHRLIDRFATGQLDGFFADWGAPAGVDITDREEWRKSNPGYNIRISEEWIAEQELAMLTPDAFAIERLGVIFAPDLTATELPEWPLCLDPTSKRSGPVSVAVDVALDLSWSSIAVAGLREDGLLHVELVEVLPGTSSTVEVLRRLCEKQQVPVWLNPRSEAGGLVKDLQAAGVQVREVGGLDLMKACVQFRQHVTNHTLRHIGQDSLDVAVAGAAVKALGDGWVWSGRRATVDISPLMAATLATFAASSAEKPFEFFVY